MALELNGTDEGLESDVNVDWAGNPGSIFLWAYQDVDFAQNDRFFNVGPAFDPVLLVDGSSIISIFWGSSVLNFDTNIGSGWSGAWHHVGITRDGSDVVRCYVGGAEEATTHTLTDQWGHSSGSQATRRIVDLGHQDGAEFWDGRFCEFAIWDVQLTASEAAELASGRSPIEVHPADLLRWWRLTNTGDLVCQITGATMSAGSEVIPTNVEHAPPISYAIPALLIPAGAPAGAIASDILGTATVAANIVGLGPLSSAVSGLATVAAAIVGLGPLSSAVAGQATIGAAIRDALSALDVFPDPAILELVAPATLLSGIVVEILEADALIRRVAEADTLIRRVVEDDVLR